MDNDDFYYNRCPIRITFTVEYDLSAINRNPLKSKSKSKYMLKFEVIKNSIAEAIKEPSNEIKNDDDDICAYQRLQSEDENILKYNIIDLELDFSIPRLFRVLLLSNENESIKASYSFSIVDLFLHSFPTENVAIYFKPQKVSFNQLPTKVAVSSDRYPSSITMKLKKRIKYPLRPKETESKDYVTQKIDKFVKTTTFYDVTVNRRDFGWWSSIFFKPYTQLKVSCEKKEIYRSPLFVNALFFKIDTFSILTSKYIDLEGIPLDQDFTLLDWTHPNEREISHQEIKKQEKNDKELATQPNTKKDTKDKEKDKYFSIEKRDLSEHTFVQLLCKGVRIQTIIAIDYSSSNRPVLIKNGLHSGDSNTNLYLGAMNCIFDTLSVFDQNNSVSLYGLCAKIKGVFHEYFKITKTKETEAGENNAVGDNKYSSKESMEAAYNHYRQMLQFWGPTKLSSFLKHAKEEAINANKKDSKVYTVLVIITDGLIDDLHDIAKTISSMTYDPIYIVFVGIGEEKSDRGFLSLKQIDDNLNQVKNSDGQEDLEIDIVKFAHFKTENLVEKSSFSISLFRDIPDELARFMNQKANNEDF